MFIDIDYNKRKKDVRLHLAKPNKRIVSHIHEKLNDSLNIKLGNINELTFSIPYFIEDEFSGEKIRNKHVDIIKEKMLIKVTLDAYKEWYIVDGIEEDSDDIDVFNVKAFSLGYEIKGKRISGLVEDSINATGLLTKILESTSWKIGTIDPIFDEMFRSFDSNADSNALDCIIQAGETYGALIEWNTISKTISFKDANNSGKFRGLTIGYGRFLRTLKRTRTSDEMVTRLYVYGDEDLSIHSVNPTGQGYIEDFSFFLYPFDRDVNKNVIQSSHFMSDELCHAILDHQSLVLEKSPIITSANQQIIEKNTQLITEQSKLETLNLELQNIEGLLDMAKSVNDTVTIEQRTAEKNAKMSEIQAQEIVVLNIENDIANLQTQIDVAQDEISYQANFTPELIEELNPYIIESTWRDARYIDAQELFNDGKKKFDEIRQPKVIIEVSIDNLLNIVEEQYYWDKLTLGDLVKVKYNEMNIEYMAKIIGIEYDFESGEAMLAIANTTDLTNDTDKLIQLLYGSASASSLVQNNKYKWDKVNAIEQQVSNLLTGEWDATKNKIIAGVNNSVEVGNRGIIVKNPDFPNEVLIIQSGVVALSKDNGETWKTAIKPDGIVAERLIGQIIAGQELLITNSSGSFVMDNNGVQIDASSFIVRSTNGGNMLDYWNQTGQFVDDFKDDSMITPYEKKMLKKEWDEIASEYGSNTAKINNFYTSDPKPQFVTDYNSRYQELYNYLFTELHGDYPLLSDINMSYTTRIDSTIFDSVFKNYKNAKTTVEEQLNIQLQNVATDAQLIANQAQQNIEAIENDIVWKIELHSSNGFIFKNGDIDTVITAKLYRGKDDYTLNVPSSSFIWKKFDKNGVIDQAWTDAHIGTGNTINVSKQDIQERAMFSCDVDIV